MMSDVEKSQSDPKNHHSSSGSTDKPTLIKEQSYHGPIPPAVEYQRYEDTLPGSADRILTMAENMQDHRIKVSEREQILHYVSKFFAQIIVGIVALVSIGAGSYLIVNGHNITGIVMLIGALTSFAGIIIYGRKENESDEE